MCCICGSNKEKRGILKFETKEKPLHAKYSQSIGNFEGSDPVSNYTHFVRNFHNTRSPGIQGMWKITVGLYFKILTPTKRLEARS